MKRLWMRVGMYLDLSDNDAESILGCDDGKMGDIVRNAFREGRYVLCGDTYIPEVCVEDFNKAYGTNYESCVLSCEL